MTQELMNAIAYFIGELTVYLFAIFLLWKITIFFSRHARSDNNLSNQTIEKNPKLKQVKIVLSWFACGISGFFLILHVIWTLKFFTGVVLCFLIKALFLIKAH